MHVCITVQWAPVSRGCLLEVFVLLKLKFQCPFVVRGAFRQNSNFLIHCSNQLNFVALMITSLGPSYDTKKIKSNTEHKLSLDRICFSDFLYSDKYKWINILFACSDINFGTQMHDVKINKLSAKSRHWPVNLSHCDMWKLYTNNLLIILVLLRS